MVPTRALITDVRVAVCVRVVIVTVAVREPAATVTLAGTVATVVVPLDIVTTTPPAGAATDNVTVATEFVPPLTDVGFNVNVDTVIDGLTVRIAVLDTPLYVAVIVVVTAAVSAFPVMTKVAEVAPAGTVTLTGTVAAVVLLDTSVTTAPPTGAADVNVTVPVLVTAPYMDDGLSVTVESAGGGGVTVRLADVVLPFVVAEIETTVLVATVPAVTVNIADVCPAATVTATGTVATFVLLDDNETTFPPVGAATLSVTVPVTCPPETIEAGESDRLCTLGPRMASVALALIPFAVALRIAVESTETTLVWMLMEADICPAGIVTVVGTDIARLELAIRTAKPPPGAIPEIRMVAFVDPPPVTEAGDNVIECGVGASMVMMADCSVPKQLAVMMTLVAIATGLASISNSPVVCPSGMTIFVGIETTVLDALSATVVPPKGAG